jgi:hypothetical protein
MKSVVSAVAAGAIGALILAFIIVSVTGCGAKYVRCPSVPVSFEFVPEGCRR